MVSKSIAGLTLALSLAGFAHAATAADAAARTECTAGASVDARVDAALARPDRPQDQRANDAGRLGETRFVFSHVKPGDHVLDMGAGRGYETYLLSAAVCNGSVDSQNPPKWVEGFKMEPARQTLVAARPNVHLVTSDFASLPLPAQPYDAIFIGTIYHDTYNEDGHNAVAMDKALLAALKPGGLVILTDHKTADGVGASATNTLHRIDKAQVLSDFKAAGFELVEDSPALANPADDHSKNVFDPSVRGHTDRMALVFRRPVN